MKSILSLKSAAQSRKGVEFGSGPVMLYEVQGMPQGRAISIRDVSRRSRLAIPFAYHGSWLNHSAIHVGWPGSKGQHRFVVRFIPAFAFSEFGGDLDYDFFSRRNTRWRRSRLKK
jgi:hypothetical protein